MNNIFGLSNELMEKVEVTKNSRKSHVSKKDVVGFDRVAGMQDRWEGASERHGEKSGSEERMGEVEVESEEDIGVDKEFIKGVKYGRESTPMGRKKVERERKKGIDKLTVKEVKEEIKKAWEEDSIASPSGQIDKVDPFDTPKMKRITRGSKF